MTTLGFRGAVFTGTPRIRAKPIWLTEKKKY
jgi:hypothetical protein